MKNRFNHVQMMGIIGFTAMLSCAAHANNIMPMFGTVTPTPNPAGWGNSGSVLGIDLYSLNRVTGFQGFSYVLTVDPAVSNPSPLQTIGGEHAVSGLVGSQLEANLWVPGSWKNNKDYGGGKVDTYMLGIMPLSVLPDLPPDGEHPNPWKPDFSYLPAIGFSNEFGDGDGTFRVWDASRASPTDPGHIVVDPDTGEIIENTFYTCGYPGKPTCWVNLDGTAPDRDGDPVPQAPVHYDAWNTLTIDFTPQFNIVYSVNNVPVYNGILDFLSLWDPLDILSYYGFTAVQMKGFYLGYNYVAQWGIDEPATLALTTLGLALIAIGRVRQHRKNAV